MMALIQPVITTFPSLFPQPEVALGRSRWHRGFPSSVAVHWLGVERIPACGSEVRTGFKYKSRIREWPGNREHLATACESKTGAGGARGVQPCNGKTAKVFRPDDYEVKLAVPVEVSDDHRGEALEFTGVQRRLECAVTVTNQHRSSPWAVRLS